MEERPFPRQVRQLAPDESFQFRCHAGVPCFNECCRLLELALSPYDVLRLKDALGLSAKQFMDQYAIVEESAATDFPLVYLAMLDDGRGSCPFVAEQGCTVYADRPGACRIYPLGRGAFRTCSGGIQNIHVLLTEPHCQGIHEKQSQSITGWEAEQGLPLYNIYNDKAIAIQQHDQMRQGMEPSPTQRRTYLATLYNLDDFGQSLLQTESSAGHNLSAQEKQALLADRSALLAYGFKWLTHELFPEQVDNL
jgi:Fe-S-cluster containining protein